METVEESVVFRKLSRSEVAAVLKTTDLPGLLSRRAVVEAARSLPVGEGLFIRRQDWALRSKGHPGAWIHAIRHKRMYKYRRYQVKFSKIEDGWTVVRMPDHIPEEVM